MKNILLSRDFKQRGEYFSIGTNTEGNNCFSVCQNIEMKQEIILMLI